MLRVLLIIMSVTMILTSVVTAKSPQEYTLTLDEAQKMALKTSNKFVEIDQQIEHLLIINNYNVNLNKETNNDTIAYIDQLYLKAESGNSISSFQMGTLFGYYAMYGDTDYFKGKDVTKLFKPEEYPNYSIWTNLLRYESNKKILKNTIYLAVRDLYDNVITLSDQINISKREYSQAVKKLDIEKVRYQAGKSTKYNYYLAEQNLLIQNKELNKLNRSLENLKLDLKKLIGISPKDGLELEAAGSYKIANTLLKYEDYLKLALDNRNEVIFAKAGYWDKLNAYNAANKKYVDNMSNYRFKTARDQALMALEEAKQSIEVAEKSIESELLSSYIDVEDKVNNLSRCANEINVQEIELKKADLNLKEKKITSDQYDKIKSELDKAKIAYSHAVIELNTAELKLRYASDIGPGYFNEVIE